MMKVFLDRNGKIIELSFTGHAFHEQVKHVFVICEYGNGWLLTKHKKRGLEFPGGKRELGETLEESARREVFEETGAILSSLVQLGEYRVQDLKETFVKAIFWGKVEQIEEKSSYFETLGPKIVTGDILQLRFGDDYSFIMKDMVVEESIHMINRIKSEKKVGLYS